MIRRIFLFVVVAVLSGIAAKASAAEWERTDFRDETIYFAMTTRF